MIHIKHFNKNVEDLEDYLQEFFDKYHIIKTPFNIKDDVDYINYYCGSDNSITIEVYENHIEIFEHLDKIIPNIERRLGSKISLNQRVGYNMEVSKKIYITKIELV